jgi:hypothetical protein
VYTTVGAVPAKECPRGGETPGGVATTTKMEAAMSSVPDPRPRAHLPPHLEALELRDFNARDCTPTQDPDAVPPDAVTEAEIDAMYVAEMERRDREPPRPAGYRDAACVACGTTLFVPIVQGGDVLCPECLREGAELAEDDDDHPRPPAGGAMHPDYPEFAASAARMLDDELCAAIGVADAEPLHFRFDERQQEAFMAAMAAEVVRRLERRAAA